jgi:hypothetical protein
MGGGDGCEDILDTTNQNTYADAIQEQCEIMVGMEACDDYFDTETIQEDVVESDYFDLKVSKDYTPQSQTEIIELTNGDSYEIVMQNINKTID